MIEQGYRGSICRCPALAWERGRPARSSISFWRDAHHWQPRLRARAGGTPALPACVLGALLALAVAGPASAQTNLAQNQTRPNSPSAPPESTEDLTPPTKLYLTDGTYQLVKSYEVHGDRVRFYSLERSDWEEVPLTMVDFDATKRAAQQENVLHQEQLNEAKELQKQRFDKPEEKGFQVAPGVHLPPDPGVYAWDGTRVITLLQSSGEVVTDKTRKALNIALPVPIQKGRQLVVLDGAKAAVRISSTRPVFYLQFPDDAAGENAQLLTVKSDKERRVVERVDTRQLPGGKPSEVREGVLTERVKLGPGLYKITPTEPLALGEYAMGELAGENLDLAVWDFGIGGKAGTIDLPATTATATDSLSEKSPVSTQPGPPKSQPQQMPNPPSPTAPQTQPNPPHLGARQLIRNKFILDGAFHTQKNLTFL